MEKAASAWKWFKGLFVGEEGSATLGSCAAIGVGSGLVGGALGGKIVDANLDKNLDPGTRKIAKAAGGAAGGVLVAAIVFSIIFPGVGGAAVLITCGIAAAVGGAVGSR